MESGDQDEDEEDDPTSNLLSPERVITTIPDDVLFLCFAWLHAAELARCMVVGKHWHEAAQDNHLWRLQCALCFHRISTKKLRNKYENSYYTFYQTHFKLRFDGCYIVKVLYYIQAEAAMPSFNTSARRANPYNAVQYYRYLRFFANKCDVIMNEATHKIENINNDQSCNAIYALSNKKPSEFALFGCFHAVDASHQNIKHTHPPSSSSSSVVVASHFEKHDGISMHEKVYRGKYDITSKKCVKLKVDTDYDLRLEFELKYYEVNTGSSDRLEMSLFDGVALGSRGNPIESTRDHFEVRHEPFLFIPDKEMKNAQHYFE
mmetsp:Transcript_6699/g.10596  ORF Transcript_6699/g.10596 Transcript_6699/m.10596 type:complete len:319 (+) Transcript_6699:88-1044(+)